MRRQFALPAEDMEWLDGCGYRYELVNESGVQRVVLHDYALPPGYSTNRASVNVRIETGYPDAQIDMVYFLPHLALTTGRTIGGLSHDQFDGQSWQRWSRHRTPANPWRPGIDGLTSHFALIDEWLVRETKKA